MNLANKYKSYITQIKEFFKLQGKNENDAERNVLISKICDEGKKILMRK